MANVNAVPSGSKATAPKCMNDGWMTKSDPTNPKAQAASRRGPTCSPIARRPISRIMNGSTNTIASASAIGMTRTAAMKQ
jgi:hypothetical protein